MRKPVEFEAFPAELAARAGFGPYRGVVKHIVDGDTLDVMLDVGLNRYPYVTLRLRGVDAPEINRAATRVAGQAARDFVATLAPLGTPCVVTTEPDAQTFGRYVATVTLADGTDLGDALVAAGHAVRTAG